MKKTIYIFFMLLISLTTFSQTNNQSDTSKLYFKTYTGAIIASRNYSRGVNFGKGISLQPYAGIFYGGLKLDFFATLTANGKYNYGTSSDFSLSYSYGMINIGIHDYYYFNKNDSTHNYFFKTSNQLMDGHYYETQLKYKYKKFYIVVAHNFHNTNLKINNDVMKTVYKLISKKTHSSL